MALVILEERRSPLSLASPLVLFFNYSSLRERHDRLVLRPPFVFCLRHSRPTFYRVYRMRSTEGFQSVPYMVALFSSMLWIYYAFVKTGAILLITINSIGCFIETIYIFIYLIFAPKTAKVSTLQLFFFLNVVLFCFIVLLTQLLADGLNRVRVLGWICVGFSISVFAAPLSIIRLVIRSRSVEYMPFSLSFFLTLSAVAWFAYGLFSKDLYVLLPNILGFAFGVAQMLLYVIISTRKNSCVKPAIPEHVTTIAPAPDLELNDVEIGIPEENGYLEDKANKEAPGDNNERAEAGDPQEMENISV
ncbi:bidirectional sugar transporter SWEET14-like [Canna indica]|uniref:Bidirectional sugar transporter SWEET n=1 Tax=Canna indica TaxID=4628 RepID=A0AAQ3KEV3_9LILI|nr:bidirectional sugar transporter SWEET14-like [Canna indica]